MLSPNFRVDNFETDEFNPHPICISYKFHGSEKFVTKELFKVGTSFPSTKTITFENKIGGLDLAISYGEGTKILPGLPT